jgi:hypothetical protein
MLCYICPYVAWTTLYCCWATFASLAIPLGLCLYGAWCCP